MTPAKEGPLSAGVPAIFRAAALGHERLAASYTLPLKTRHTASNSAQSPLGLAGCFGSGDRDHGCPEKAEKAEIGPRQPLSRAQRMREDVVCPILRIRFEKAG
jgi:hypothetical protein